jgi:GT2 family glycosyltransferase
MPANNISVIIVNYNTRQLLLDCLHSLEENPNGLSVDIWVVDNASTDGSVAAVQSSFPEVHIIANDSNLGFARANNQALRKASGDIMLLLNPDSRVQPCAFTKLKQAFDSDATIGVVGPQVLNPDGSIQPSCGSFASGWTEFLFQSFLFKLIPSPFPIGAVVHPLQRRMYDRKHEVDWVTGACLAIRKEVVMRIGLLDEAFFMYGEDMEWCWRVRQAGYKVIYQPAAQVVHYSRQASQRDYRAWIMQYTSGHLRFIGKTRPGSYKFLFGLWICLGSLLRIVVWSGLRWLIYNRRDEAQQRIAGYREAFNLGWQAVLGKPA